MSHNYLQLNSDDIVKPVNSFIYKCCYFSFISLSLILLYSYKSEFTCKLNYKKCLVIFLPFLLKIKHHCNIRFYIPSSRLNHTLIIVMLCLPALTVMSSSAVGLLFCWIISVIHCLNSRCHFFGVRIYTIYAVSNAFQFTNNETELLLVFF